MSQADVLHLLKRRNRWMATREIVKELGANSSTISQSLTKLKKYGFVESKLIKEKLPNRNQWINFFKYRSG
jgi:predicted transcriptional regulator